MRKLLLLLVLIQYVSYNGTSQTYGWIVLNADSIPGTPDFSDVFFVNDSVGWITSSSAAEIYHTTDGGQTFDVQTTQLETEAIHMLGIDTGFAGGASGFVYKTVNGGDNWTFHGTIGTSLNDITFPPIGGIGYACGDNGAITSINSTVTPLSSGVPDNLYSIVFPMDSSEGWCCGGSILIHYIHGSWIGDQFKPSGGYYAIYMVDTLNGWAVGDKIIHTNNGWNWSTQYTNLSYAFTDVFFLDIQKGWVVGSPGLIIHTINGGTTWIIEAAGLTNSLLRGVHFTSPTNGYVVGNGKTLLKYTQISAVEEQAVKPDITIYPNPVEEELFISFPSDHLKVETVNIIDPVGRIVKSESFKTVANGVSIHVGDLETGIYFCVVLVDGMHITRKIIVL